MKWGHVSLALLCLSRGETLWRCIASETVVRHFLLVLFGDYNPSFLQLPLQSWNKVINNIWYFSDKLNKIPRCFANVRLLPELSLECLFPTVRFHFPFVMFKFIKNRHYVSISIESQGQASRWSQPIDTNQGADSWTWLLLNYSSREDWKLRL